MPKRKCVFNESLQKKYPYIKKGNSDSQVKCDKCGGNFNIANCGGGDIETHIKSQKHQKMMSAASSSKNIGHFLNAASKPELKNAAWEGVWAYHTVAENHSYRSNDCATKIFRICFDMTKFSCSRTKSESIVTNVFAPHALQILKNELEKCRFVCLSTDASNHHAIKMFPVVIRYFLPTVGVRVKVINFSQEEGEKAETIFALLRKTIDEHNLLDKVVAFCGDNAPVNFGNVNRGGQVNVFARLKKIKPNIVGIGCAAHIVHNALRNACDGLDIEVESVVVKIFTHFYIYTTRVEALKLICETTQEDYDQLLGYSKTRFLALRAAIDKIIKIFTPLKIHFDGLPPSRKKTKSVREFFDNPVSKLWLLFIRDQVYISHIYFLNILYFQIFK